MAAGWERRNSPVPRGRIYLCCTYFAVRLDLLFWLQVKIIHQLPSVQPTLLANMYAGGIGPFQYKLYMYLGH